MMKPEQRTVMALVMALMASPSQAQQIGEASIECRQVGPTCSPNACPSSSSACMWCAWSTCSAALSSTSRTPTG